jgi:hypothetical protein
MNDVMQAFALIGAYSLGILTVLLAIYWFILKEDWKKQQDDEMAMAKAVGVVQEAIPGSTILSHETH